MELDEVTITDNTKKAIFIDNLSKEMLTFRNEKVDRELIKGDIGGEWGQLWPKKKKSCVKKCTLM
jgi:hypothetical protein